MSMYKNPISFPPFMKPKNKRLYFYRKRTEKELLGIFFRTIELYYFALFGDDEAEQMDKSKMRCFTLCFEDEKSFLSGIEYFHKLSLKNPYIFDDIKIKIKNNKCNLYNVALLINNIFENCYNMYFEIPPKEIIDNCNGLDNIRICTRIIYDNKSLCKWYVKK